MQRALEISSQMLGKGAASEARNASVVSGVRADRARELEESARAEELHAGALDRRVGEEVLGLVVAMLGDCGLPVPFSLLRGRLEAWPAAPAQDLVERGADVLRRAIRQELREEIERERVEAESAAAEVVDADVVDEQPPGDAEEAEQPVRGPERVRPMGPNGPARSDAEIRRIAAAAARRDDGHPGFLAGRRGGGRW